MPVTSESGGSISEESSSVSSADLGAASAGTVGVEGRPSRRRAIARRDLLPLAALATVAMLVLAVGVMLRAWFLVHQPLNSDEAIAGLMAAQIRHGHLYTFYWGQSYGGVEPYVVALLSFVFGSGAASVSLTPVVLGGISAALVWRVVRRLVPAGARWLGLAAGCAFWVWPGAGLWNSTVEWGFRGVAMAAGLASVLFALRAVDLGSWGDLGVLGLFLGVGWWSSPEFIYFLIPVAGILLAGLRERGWATGWASMLLIPAGFVVGAAPWLWTNIRTGFVSLSASSSPAYVHATYFGRISIFFSKTLPMMLGLRVPLSGIWISRAAGPDLYVIALLVVGLVCIQGLLYLRRRDLPARTGWCALGVVTFPFLIAVFPATSYWNKGDYGVYVVPLIILAMAGVVGTWSTAKGRRTADRVGRVGRRWWLPAVGTVALLAVTTSTLFTFDDGWLRPAHVSFRSGWHNPNAIAEESLQALERDHLRYGWAQYWVAYDLDLLSHDRLALSDLYSDRWVGLYYQVEVAPSQAWVFYNPAEVPEASAAFQSSALGPDGYPESLFLAKLATLGVGYHIFRAGLLDAVVPNRSVAQQEVGIPPPYWH